MTREDLRQDIRDIWSAVDSIRAGQDIQNNMLAEIKAMLAERCTARVLRIDALDREVRELRQRVWTFSGMAAVLAFLAQRLWTRLWP
jgi:polyhydroxyalkanoate synthesis regulator phasin